MSNPKLEDYTQDGPEEYFFPGVDAAVIFVPNGAVNSGEIEEALSRSSQQRWYPVEGGHNAKIPYYFAKGKEHLFEREPKGWDHDHCSFCEERIEINEQSWIVRAKKGGGWHLFCKACYQKLPPR